MVFIGDPWEPSFRLPDDCMSLLWGFRGGGHKLFSMKFYRGRIRTFAELKRSTEEWENRPCEPDRGWGPITEPAESHFHSSETAVIITFAVDKMVINCLKCSKLQRDSLAFPFPGARYLTFCIWTPHSKDLFQKAYPRSYIVSLLLIFSKAELTLLCFCLSWNYNFYSENLELHKIE